MKKEINKLEKKLLKFKDKPGQLEKLDLFFKKECIKIGL